MLGKLLKYEFRSTGRVFLPFYGALVVVAIVTRILNSVKPSGRVGLIAPQLIGIVVTALMLGAVCVIAIILTIQRFNRNLLGDEGYLMFTLPVGTDSLIWSKLIVSVVWFLLSAVFGLFAIAILTPNLTREILKGIGVLFRDLFGHGAARDFSTVIYLLSGVLSVVWAVLSVYTAGSLAMLVNRRRGLAAFGFWIGITTVAQIIGTLLLTWATHIDYSAWWNELSYGTREVLGSLAVCATALVGSAALYIITRVMLKRRLNLE
ncbi:MAG: hypothetical protein LBN99_07390 [Oscillospiraceae bacterium]|jgi:hypothetical protein|nr:hypothetical protein [Oscillospiraceae bacterium]